MRQINLGPSTVPRPEQSLESSCPQRFEKRGSRARFPLIGSMVWHSWAQTEHVASEIRGVAPKCLCDLRPDFSGFFNRLAGSDRLCCATGTAKIAEPSTAEKSNETSTRLPPGRHFVRR